MVEGIPERPASLRRGTAEVRRCYRVLARIQSRYRGVLASRVTEMISGVS